ncbi:YdcF family protein [Undibacterium sp. JH2W]|uniref:YdcF family protein n=1 Tax=Undibacterium sp. JH2W TaxID=3413037 RepID=UPI003BF4C1E7
MLLAGYLAVMWSIAAYPALLSQQFAATEKTKADAAIILGASVWKDKPSPVFVERINYGIQLYQSGQVTHLIFTGGLSKGDTLSEAAAARQYAIAAGVPASQILIEEVSKNTYQNLQQACKLMQVNQFKSSMVVSDPLHMKRAMSMAQDLHLHATSAATPTSLYVGWSAKGQFLLYESLFYVKYKLLGEAENSCMSKKT